MNRVKRLASVGLAAVMALMIASCGEMAPLDKNLIQEKKGPERVVNLFSPMEKTSPNLENVARSAFDTTIAMAEQKLGVSVAYRTYTAEDHQDKTYDDVLLDRVRSNMDDIYLMNPDTLQILGEEGLLMDLSGLECVKNLRDIVKEANTVDGKLVGIPQEMVAYGLFVNKEMFDRYQLSLPETPEDLLHCCEVFQKNGIETPIGANRWWLEVLVFAQAYADLYNGGDVAAEIAALNSGEKKYSDYMRPGFTFLKELIDKGYIDAEKALVSEAIEGEGPDFLAQRTPMVMAYWGAANTETAYGNPDFELQIIGLPSSRGQMPVISMTGFSVGAGSEHAEDAMATLDVILSDEALRSYTSVNKVISSSKNVAADCIPALKPLNDKIQQDVFVLATNANMKVEQWGNTCLIIRELLAGASVDECMAAFDRLQEEAVQKQAERG